MNIDESSCFDCRNWVGSDFAWHGLLDNHSFLEARNYSALTKSNSCPELSIYANAIAMKYLSDEQLASIANIGSDSLSCNSGQVSQRFMLKYCSSSIIFLLA